MSTAISVEHLSKAYRLGTIGGGTLSGDLSRWWAQVRRKPDPTLKIGQEHHARRVGEQFWALEDVNFDVQQGEVLGIIGRNGAGKSTMLKILSQVTAPTSGQIKVRGRIASLLEVGTGFHPELTGRENVFLNGAILGMTKAEIRRKFDEIVAFSECEDFIDTPVKRYSSGMYVRLAFAVAAHLEPEILVVDEVLAVGDAQFQSKCLGKMGEVSRGGRTVLFVSHNMGAVRRLCRRAVLLDGGRVSMVGECAEAIGQYLGLSNSTGIWRRTAAPPAGSPVCLTEVSLANKSGTLTSTLASTESFTLNITLDVSAPTPPMQVPVRITNHEGVVILTTSNVDHTRTLVALPEGRHRYQVTVPGNFLSPGTYSLLVAAHVPGFVLFDILENFNFTIEDTGTIASAIGDGRWGVVTPLLLWERIEESKGPARLLANEVKT